MLTISLYKRHYRDESSHSEGSKGQLKIEKRGVSATKIPNVWPYIWKVCAPYNPGNVVLSPRGDDPRSLERVRMDTIRLPDWKPPSKEGAEEVEVDANPPVLFTGYDILPGYFKEVSVKGGIFANIKNGWLVAVPIIVPSIAKKEGAYKGIGSRVLVRQKGKKAPARFAGGERLIGGGEKEIVDISRVTKEGGYLDASEVVRKLTKKDEEDEETRMLREAEELDKRDAEEDMPGKEEMALAKKLRKLDLSDVNELSDEPEPLDNDDIDEADEDDENYVDKSTDYGEGGDDGGSDEGDEEGGASGGGVGVEEDDESPIIVKKLSKDEHIDMIVGYKYYIARIDDRPRNQMKVTRIGARDHTSTVPTNLFLIPYKHKIIEKKTKLDEKEIEILQSDAKLRAVLEDAKTSNKKLEIVTIHGVTIEVDVVESMVKKGGVVTKTKKFRLKPAGQAGGFENLREERELDRKGLADFVANSDWVAGIVVDGKFKLTTRRAIKLSSATALNKPVDSDLRGFVLGMYRDLFTRKYKPSGRLPKYKLGGDVEYSQALLYDVIEPLGPQTEEDKRSADIHFEERLRQFETDYSNNLVSTIISDYLNLPKLRACIKTAAVGEKTEAEIKSLIFGPGIDMVNPDYKIPPVKKGRDGHLQRAWSVLKHSEEVIDRSSVLCTRYFNEAIGEMLVLVSDRKIIDPEYNLLDFFDDLINPPFHPEAILKHLDAYPINPEVSERISRWCRGMSLGELVDELITNELPSKLVDSWTNLVLRTFNNPGDWVPFYVSIVTKSNLFATGAVIEISGDRACIGEGTCIRLPMGVVEGGVVEIPPNQPTAEIPESSKLKRDTFNHIFPEYAMSSLALAAVECVSKKHPDLLSVSPHDYIRLLVISVLMNKLVRVCSQLVAKIKLDGASLFEGRVSTYECVLSSIVKTKEKTGDEELVKTYYHNGKRIYDIPEELDRIYRDKPCGWRHTIDRQPGGKKIKGRDLMNYIGNAMSTLLAPSSLAFRLALDGIANLSLDRLYVAVEFNAWRDANKKYVNEKTVEVVQKLKEARNIAKSSGPKKKGGENLYAILQTPYDDQTIEDKCIELENNAYEYAGGDEATALRYLRAALPIVFFYSASQPTTSEPIPPGEEKPPAGLGSREKLGELAKYAKSKIANGDYDISDLYSLSPVEIIPELFSDPSISRVQTYKEVTRAFDMYVTYVWNKFANMTGRERGNDLILSRYGIYGEGWGEIEALVKKIPSTPISPSCIEGGIGNVVLCLNARGEFSCFNIVKELENIFESKSTRDQKTITALKRVFLKSILSDTPKAEDRFGKALVKKHKDRLIEEALKKYKLKWVITPSTKESDRTTKEDLLRGAKREFGTKTLDMLLDIAKRT